MIISFAFFCLVCVPGEDSKDAPRSSGAPTRPADELTAQLHKEAKRLETGHASDFFEALAKSDGAGDVSSISSEQAALVRGLDEVARNALRS
jgi:hypothetical protein